MSKLWRTRSGTIGATRNPPTQGMIGGSFGREFNSKKRGLKKLLLGCFAAILSIAHVSAQVSTAELSGAVVDPSGAAVANAKVVAITTATNQPHETVTSSSGTYVLTPLPPGDYRLEVESPGFKKLEQTGLTLQ